jgi:hypothetical protein
LTSEDWLAARRKAPPSDHQDEHPARYETVLFPALEPHLPSLVVLDEQGNEQIATMDADGDKPEGAHGGRGSVVVAGRGFSLTPTTSHLVPQPPRSNSRTSLLREGKIPGLAARPLS